MAVRYGVVALRQDPPLYAADESKGTAETVQTVNVAAILILSGGNCGLSACTTRYLTAMAASDLLLAVADVILWRLKEYYFPGTFLDLTPGCSVRSVLKRAALDLSVWFTVDFTFDRFVAIGCPKLRTSYCTEQTAMTVLVITGVLFFLKNIPYYFAIVPRMTINGVPWHCNPKPSIYTETAWLAFVWLDRTLTPVLPFALIFLFNALTVRHILVASQLRKGLRGQSNRSDPEIAGRRKSIVLLFAISGSFVTLWSLYVINFLYYNVKGTNYNDSEYIFRRVGYMFLNLSSCTNSFIYVVTQSKFRMRLTLALKYPFIRIIKILNRFKSQK
ncbi:probable G-protein coupled receptor 139 [Hemitrygon akajei]|uniref:probable G-protein coupled receptor 139 n=1 Tax=Hemitrygon akajei TaxID=2704970 RepID=UPI003BF9AC17